MTKDNQKALSLITKTKLLEPTKGGFSLIPETNEFEQNYVVHRINLPSIEVTSKMRVFVEQAMEAGKRFVRIGDHTVMVNSISGIDPLKKKYKPLGISQMITPDGKHIFDKKTGKKYKIGE